MPIEYCLTDAFGTIDRMYWALGFWTDPVSDEDLENAKKLFEDAGGVRHGGTPEFTEIKEWIDNGMPIAKNIPEHFMAIDGYLESNPSPSRNKFIIKIYKS